MVRKSGKEAKPAQSLMRSSKPGPTPGAVKRPRRRLSEQERRSQIIQDVKQVFLLNGFDGSRTKDLAEAAGVTEATLFVYFRSKNELFEAVIMDPLKESILASQDERIAAYLNAETEDDKYQVTLAGVRRFLETFQRIYPMLTIALFSANKRSDEFYRQHFGEFLKRAMVAAKPLLVQNLFSTVSTETLVFLMSGFSFSQMIDASFRNRTLDLQKLSEEYTEILFYGIRGKQQIRALESENAKLRARLAKFEKRPL